jgi:DNA-binding Lrp family transcriptional regulator
VKLTEDERKIVTCLYFDAQMSLREVAHKTGLREHVARHCLQKLLDKKAIKYRAFVNPYAAGLCEYVLFIGTQLMQPSARQALLTALLESPHTTYVGTVGGEYHLAVMIVARNLGDVTQFVDSLSNAVKGAAFEVSISTCVSVTLFQPKFLGVGDSEMTSISYGTTEKVVNLDTLDHKILHALGTSPELSSAQLSKVLGAPASTVTYREQSLRERGVLVGIGLTIPPFNDGYFAFALHVHAGSMPKAIRDTFREYCSKHPSISYLIEVLGAWNFQVGARFEDSRSVPVLADDIQRRFAPYVSSITVSPVYETLKLSPHPLMSAWTHGRNREVA